MALIERHLGRIKSDTHETRPHPLSKGFFLVAVIVLFSLMGSWAYTDITGLDLGARNPIVGTSSPSVSNSEEKDRGQKASDYLREKIVAMYGKSSEDVQLEEITQTEYIKALSTYGEGYYFEENLWKSGIDGRVSVFYFRCTDPGDATTLESIWYNQVAQLESGWATDLQ